jgi:two-component system sensor histidine kinase KdpD
MPRELKADARPDPDALIEAAAREGRGRLKVFLGAAPGVGKTWEMLTAGRQAIADGIEVLIGVVETHGRAETEAQIGAIPILPRHKIEYRGQILEEFDIDAALARRPKLLLVDELAHTNAPGSRHMKRWEDVEELLAAGIDVWATLNVQHLESLNDAVARITGVRVRETLPDHVLERADSIELIDLPPAELRARLTGGRIYRPDVANRALEGFFREGNLAALREMALRRAAERVDADVTGYMRAKAITGPWPAGERVLALVGADPASEAVVRQARRLAEALRAPWIALHVEQSNSAAARPAMTMAQQLGAELETAAGGDLVGTVLELARKRNVTHIVMGRARPPLLRRLIGRSLARAMLRRSTDFTLHVVPAPSLVPIKAPRLPRPPVQVVPWVVSVALVGLVVGIGEVLERLVPAEALGMLFLAAVVAAATLYGLAVALFAAALSFVAWDFFFLPPRLTFTIGSPRDLIALFVFLGVACATGLIASRLRTETQAAQGRIQGLRRISQFSRQLGTPTNEPELLDEIARQAAEIAGAALVLTPVGEDLNIRAAQPPADTMDEAGWAAARWAFSRKEETGRGTGTLPSASWRFMPMRTVRGMVGVLGVRAEESRLDPPLLQTLSALADQAAVAMERVRLANEAARSAAQAETQKLRTALLSSLSHDLRTPLAGIRGAADTLRSAWAALDDATREDLLQSIEDDIGRMTRFLGNIMEMTRLESGEIVPRRVTIALDEVVQAAIARVPGGAPVAVDLPAALPPLVADPSLLEQVMVNLLDNAVKYSPPGSLVRVGAGVSGMSIAIEVRDEGIGIPAEDLPHVFDSFYRAGRGDRVAPGTGLGLAIARGLTEAMGGTIAAQSPRPDTPRDNPHGTIVTLRFPLVPAARPQGQIAEPVAP